jgi:hypothetical protein
MPLIFALETSTYPPITLSAVEDKIPSNFDPSP